MKTIKIILAWLDWSNYCTNFNYTFPNNLCSLFWRTFFSIIVLPLGYLTHLWNIFHTINNFKHERYSHSKIGLNFGIVLHLIIGIIGFTASKDVIERILFWDWFQSSDPYLLNYIKVLGIGFLVAVSSLIVIGIVVAIGYWAWLLFEYLKDSFHRKIFANKEKMSGDYIEMDPKPSVIKQIYKSVKDEYCPLIDWSDIKE